MHSSMVRQAILVLEATNTTGCHRLHGYIIPNAVVPTADMHLEVAKGCLHSIKHLHARPQPNPLIHTCSCDREMMCLHSSGLRKLWYTKALGFQEMA